MVSGKSPLKSWKIKSRTESFRINYSKSVLNYLVTSVKRYRLIELDKFVANADSVASDNSVAAGPTRKELG
jgi:hypothetical protein